ncbi:MAG: fumarate reductase subunit FrdD [Candidatus Latescibacterota bacterium]|nr:fumarate reductase subunit FrdD [Candidatus Latescibacterota bacterium]
MNYKKDTTEPFWWGMFSAGGVVAALFIPIHIFIDGLAVPLGLMDGRQVGFERMHALVAHPALKVYLFVLIVMPLYHAAHRIRFSLYELGMREFRISMGVLCYGGALAATAGATYVLMKVL